MAQKSLSNKVVGAFGATLVVTLIQLVLLLLTTHHFSLSDQGILRLFILDITIMAQVSAIIGGSVLVYLVSRSDLKSLLIPGYIWTLVSGIITSSVLYFIDQVDEELFWLLLASGLLQGLVSIHQQVLLGMNNVRAYNWSQLLLYGSSLVLVYVLIFHEGNKDLEDYIIGYLIALGITWLVTAQWISPKIDWKAPRDKEVLKKLWQLGGLDSLGSLAQTLNNRFSFYMLSESFIVGKALVGLFSIGLSIVEKLLILSRSFSSVQYAEIANSRTEGEPERITKSFQKLNLYLTLLGVLVVALIPESAYLYVVSEKYAGIKEIIVPLGIGILILSVSNILSHHFSGLGLYRINTRAAFLGLAITLGLGIYLIPEKGIEGAVITTIASYATICVYQFVQFYRRVEFSIQDWVLSKEDIDLIRRARS